MLMAEHYYALMATFGDSIGGSLLECPHWTLLKSRLLNAEHERRSSKCPFEPRMLSYRATPICRYMQTGISSNMKSKISNNMGAYRIKWQVYRIIISD